MNYVMIQDEPFDLTAGFGDAQAEMLLIGQDSADVWTTAHTTVGEAEAAGFDGARKNGEVIYPFTDLEEKIVGLAKESASLFVEEFNEALDPATTDWDGEAWDLDAGKLFGALGLSDHWKSELTDEFWEVYQHALVAETRALVSGG